MKTKTISQEYREYIKIKENPYSIAHYRILRKSYSIEEVISRERLPYSGRGQGKKIITDKDKAYIKYFYENSYDPKRYKQLSRITWYSYTTIFKYRN